MPSPKEITEVIQDAEDEQKLKDYVEAISSQYADLKVAEVHNQYARQIEAFQHEIKILNEALHNKSHDFVKLEQTYIQELRELKDAHISDTVSKEVSELMAEFNKVKAEDNAKIEELIKKNEHLSAHLEKRKPVLL